MAEQKSKANKPFSVAFYLAISYMLLVSGVYVVTAATTTVNKDGLDWFPFMMLTLPWWRLGASFVVPGVFINAVLLYGFGRLAEALLSR